MKWTPRQTKFAWRPVKCAVCMDKVWLEPYYPCGPAMLPHKDWRHCRPCYAAALLRSKDEQGNGLLDQLLKSKYSAAMQAKMAQTYGGGAASTPKSYAP